MALQHQHTLSSGIFLPEAYTRISSIAYGHTELVVSTSTFADHAARLADKPAVETLSFSLPWTDSISIAGCYNLLKQQDFFAGAIDV